MMQDAAAGKMEGLDEPMDIVNCIEELATGKSEKFRNVLGTAGNSLMQLRASVPIEQYLETIAQNYK
jgi:hypothetical protein